MQKFSLLIILLLLPILLTGCFEKREIEDLAYVIAIGIDKGKEEGKVSISFQIAVPIKIAGEGSNGSGKESTSLITLETDSISNAVSRADTMISKEITLSHNKIIVFSEELAKEGIDYYLSAFVTNREIRPKTSVIIHKGKAEDFLKNLEPVLESNPARYYDLILDSNEYTGYATDNSLFRFYLSVRDELSSPYAMLTESVEDENNSVSLENSQKQGENSKQKSTQEEQSKQEQSQNQEQDSSQEPYSNQEQDSKQNQNDNLKASSHEPTPQGNTNSSKEEKTSENSLPKTANIAGIAIFKSGKLVGEIKNEEIISQLILQNNMKKVNIDIEDIQDSKKNSVIKLVQLDNTDIKINIINNIPHIDIVAKLNCQLLTSGSAINYNDKENRKKLENNIQKKLKKDMYSYLKNISKNMKADPVGFGKYCRLNVNTLNELSQIKWSEIFPSSKFNVTFKLHLDTTQMVSNEQRE